jgi:hypothetical protein
MPIWAQLARNGLTIAGMCLGRTFLEGLAHAHTQALNLTEGMCVPAMAWLAWCEVFRRGFDTSSRHGFLVVSRFDFCQQILSADFSRQQICSLILRWIFLLPVLTCPLYPVFLMKLIQITFTLTAVGRRNTSWHWTKQYWLHRIVVQVFWANPGIFASCWRRGSQYEDRRTSFVWHCISFHGLSLWHWCNWSWTW